jgi:hypothetical protein
MVLMVFFPLGCNTQPRISHPLVFLLSSKFISLSMELLYIDQPTHMVACQLDISTCLLGIEKQNKPNQHKDF